MNTGKIYEHVCKVKPIPQDRFFAALNYTERELVSKYGKDTVLDRAALIDIVRLDDDTGTKAAFDNAIIDNILYLVTGEEHYKTDFAAHAQYAYHTVWNEKNRGKRIRKEIW